MEVKNTVQNLIKDIQEFEKKIDTLKNSSPISAIEIDLVLSKLRNLYESLLQLKEETGKGEETVPLNDPDEKPEEEIHAGSEPDATEHSEQEKLEEPTEEPVQDFELEEATGAENDKDPESEIHPEHTGNDEEKPGGIIADHLTAPKHFRNETLAQTRKGNDLSSKLQSKPLEDISSAIGINDRFLYIKELFEGNSKKFDETIKVLNNSPNFNEAFNYLSENFNWDMDNPSVQSLLELARRKHIINTDE